MGGFLLTIPSGVQPASQRQIISAIATMVSAEAMKARIQNGFSVAPPCSVCADPEALALSPIVRTGDQLARRIEIVTWPRPPIPEHILIEGTPGGQIKAA